MGKSKVKHSKVYSLFKNLKVYLRLALFLPASLQAKNPRLLSISQNDCILSKNLYVVPALTRRKALQTALTAGAATGAAALGLAGCARDGGNGSAATSDTAKPATGSTFAFDTYCTFTVYGDNTALSKLSDACQRYDALFDLYKEDSDIAHINAAAGQPVTVDPATADLIARALDYCAQAEGRFDITIGAVSTLWDFDAGARPTDEQIAAALPHVNWQNVVVNEQAHTVQLTDPEAKLDLGGIAKGYVADRLCELLRDKTQATAAVLSLGGNVAFYGSKPGGGTWDAGIRDPNDPGGSTTVGTAHVSDGSLVTSGLYERTFELNGVTYWHILDPRTGMPVQTDVESVTVDCPSSTTADALSTTLFVAGSRSGSAIVDAHDDTAAYFLLQNGSTAESSRWQELTDFER